MINVLLAALTIALTAAGIVLLVRAIPWVIGKISNGVKPWACDLCMSFWSTLLAALCWPGCPSATLPAFAITFALVRMNGAPRGAPPSFEVPLDSSDIEEIK